MILDEPERFSELDSLNMLGYIGELPDQLQSAWDIGQTYPLPQADSVKQVVVAGMGGSAIGGDLVAALTVAAANVPIVIRRDYDLPGYVADDATLLIASSHSGNTEETLSVFRQAVQVGATTMAITTGGALASEAELAGVPVWRFAHDGQPRAAVGFSFGLLLAALARLGLVELSPSDLMEAVTSMKEQIELIGAEVPVAQNLAKRMAGQFMDRWPTIVAADFLAPVARRWRTQIAEIAKAVAQFEELPEADHNMIAGVENPEAMFGPTMVVFLKSAHNHARNIKRIDATRQILMLEGFNTDILEAHGESRLAHQWTMLHLGDYIAYYLAMAYGVDPTPVQAIEDLKEQLKAD